MKANENARFAERMANLHQLLRAAMMVELTTIPAYLHAAFSIEDVGAEHINHAPREAIRSVLVEEMLHLALVANILNATGGRPLLDHPDWVPPYPCSLFPQVLSDCTLNDAETGDNFPIHVSSELVVHLRPFSRDQVSLFEDIEVQHTSPDAVRGGEIDSIGRFYGGLDAELCQLVAQYGSQAVFSGDPARQVGPEHYYGAGGRLTKIGCQRGDPLREARGAIALITDEGEGLEHGHAVFDGVARPGEPGQEVAHVFKFREILASRRYRPGDRWDEAPSGDPIAVDWNAVWPITHDPEAPAPGDNTTAAMQDFDRRYSDLLRTVNRGFLGEPELLMTAVVKMFELKYKGLALMRTPRGDGSNAAPAWRWRAD